jgi:hypothetical protein
VTESNGTVEITIVKKVPQDIVIGYRTVSDSATSPKDYIHTEDVIKIDKKTTETKIYIPIKDDSEWEPDLDFYVELFDPQIVGDDGKPKKLEGDDTLCKVTILDEDFPGTLGFEATEIRVGKN